MNRFDSSDDFEDALALANGATEPPRKPTESAPSARASSPTSTDWSTARTTARDAAHAGEATVLPLHRATGHSLAEPLVARIDLPAFDTSAMDGWAVAGPGPWTLTAASGASLPADAAPSARTDRPGTARGAVLAGDRAAPEPLRDGYAVPIATGARVPAGTTGVLRTEHGTVDGDRLTATREARNPAGPTADAPWARTDIRPRGQECRSGDLLLPAGSRLTPAAVGLAAAAGYDELTVTRRPRVEVLVLGAELVLSGTPAPGLIRDALGPLLDPWLTALGAEVLAVRHLGDDAEALDEAVAATDADVLLTTGGTAAGPVDHVRPLLARLGARTLVDSVAVRPGHPMLLAALPARSEAGPRYLVGLPGNPLAAVSGLLTLAEPLLRTLADNEPHRAPALGRLTDSVTGHPRDTRLVPVAETPQGVRPLHYQGPAMLRGIAAATAMAVIPPGGAHHGAAVELLPLPRP